MRLLGTHGADAAAADKGGKTAYDLADSSDIKAMLKRVTDAGDNAEEKARLAVESAEQEAVDAEARRVADQEERRIEAEAAAASKAAAEERMAREAQARQQRALAQAQAKAAASLAEPAAAPAGASPRPPMAPGSPATPTSPGAAASESDEDDEPTPGDRAMHQIPRQDALEALRSAANAQAKAKADAWRTARDAQRRDLEVKAAAKHADMLRLAKAASELKKTQEEERKAKQEEEAAVKRQAIAALVAKMNDPLLTVPEAEEGAFSYAQLLAHAGKEEMRDAGILSQKREAYLSAADFERVFDMPKAAFYALPAWKQAKLKKDKSLF